jgi:hypothetical protein
MPECRVSTCFNCVGIRMFWSNGELRRVWRWLRRCAGERVSPREGAGALSTHDKHVRGRNGTHGRPYFTRHLDIESLALYHALIHPRLWGPRRFPVWKLGAAALFEDSCRVDPMLALAAIIACRPADGYAGIAGPEPTQKRGTGS